MQVGSSALDAEFIGIELNHDYARRAEEFGRVIRADAFRYDFSSVPWRSSGPLLVIGNPPWVTNAQLSTLDSSNLPIKGNLRGLKGLDALTGASNFDIAEFIWLKLIVELVAESPTIALLCKTQVARNVLSYCHQFALPVHNASLYQIDAKRWFGASVDACLFILSVGVATQARSYRCHIFPSLDAAEPSRTFGVVDNLLVADVGAYKQSRSFDGTSHVEWRQGVKHDAAAVMELKCDGGSLINKSGEIVDVEPDKRYPLMKSTDIFRDVTQCSREVLLPQKTLGADTDILAHESPRLWRYLNEHDEVFSRRRSSIYRGRPRFSIFGIGEYTFAPYKVAISGLHKEPRFRLVAPLDGKPVVFDDTCYFLPFESPGAAALAYALLTSDQALTLLGSLVFWDAKRPVTKKLLQRVDLRRLASALDPNDVAAAANRALAAIGIAAQVDRESVEAFATGDSAQSPSAPLKEAGRGQVARSSTEVVQVEASENTQGVRPATGH